MDWVDYLRVLRHRWKVVAATALVALIAAWVTTSVAPVAVGNVASLYRATTVLLNTGTVESLGLTNLETAAELVKIGDVPKRVATVLKTTESPQSLASQIETTVDVRTGVLRITATSPDKTRAETLANTFADELIAFLAERKTRTIATQTDALSRQLARLRAEIDTLARRVASAKSVADQAIYATERDAKIRQYGIIYEFYNRLSDEASTPGGLQVLQEGEGLPVSTGGFSAPRTRGSRLILGGILGVMAGAVVAFVLERVDTRIRTKDQAEDGFALPVLAEVPLFIHTGRGPTVESVAHPSSAASHSFRLLRGSVMQESRLRTGWDGNGEGRFSGTFLVTSAAPADGKTTVVANLAPVFAEIGLSVLILSCDFRRPEVHRYYRVPNERGLVDALKAADGWRILEGINIRTNIRDVRLVPSGPVPQNPGELMSSDWMREVLNEARRSADVVLIDTAPILAASDASYLLPQVDGVIVVCRQNRTTMELAQRTTEMLRRLGANPLGVVLNGLRGSSVLSRGYYEYSSDRKPRGMRRLVQRTRRESPRADVVTQAPPKAPAARTMPQRQEPQEPWEARRFREMRETHDAAETLRKPPETVHQPPETVHQPPETLDLREPSENVDAHESRTAQEPSASEQAKLATPPEST